MSQLRADHDDFIGAIDQAARKLGLAPLFVEKDYWVTQVLRALSAQYPGWFVFKGGTSLSKGYDLIERFSEDVDILVSPASDDSAKVREARLLDMTKAVAAALSVEWIESRPPGRGLWAHRADVMVYPRQTRTRIVVPIEDRGVLLETGYAGGTWPSEMVTITPLLCEPLGIDPSEFEDTAPFSVSALKPGRTLLEKLSLLHHVAQGYLDDGEGDPRCGRHYYDIYRLLDHAPARDLLKDREEFERIMSEMEQISARHFGDWMARPEGGYGVSPAFTASKDSRLRDWLEERYRDSADLMPAKVSGSWPSFGKVLGRVAEFQDLL